MEEWRGEHRHRLAVNLDDARGRRSALVEDAQRLVDHPRPQEPEPRIDSEDVEAVVRHRPSRDHVGHVLPGPAEAAAKPILDVPHKQCGLDTVEQLVPHPVRLDDARVERIDDPVRPGDTLEVPSRSSVSAMS